MTGISPEVTAAYIGGFFTVIALIVGAVFSSITGILAIARSIKERHGRLSMEISMAIANEPGIARRFAIGVIKVEMFGENEEARGEIRFVPLNARITVGRDASNEFILQDIKRVVSRMHCGFVSDGKRVYVEDYGSVNGTSVNGVAVEPGSPRELKNGDTITLPALVEKPTFVATFYEIHRSSFW
ncbi:MAG TPA: FHA domain-containing protein [Brevundimonas sp.]